MADDVRPLASYDGSLQEIPDSDTISDKIVPTDPAVTELSRKFDLLIEFLQGLGFEIPDEYFNL